MGGPDPAPPVGGVQGSLASPHGRWREPFPGPKAAYLGGREAAALLGVKRETLYAYASRGLVRSEPGERGRARRYHAEDLERLKVRHDARSGHGPVAAAALRWGEPVLESAITALGPEGPRYRGLTATALAASARFEAVAELLWTGALPERAPGWSAAHLGLPAAALATLLRGPAHPVTTLAVAVPALAAADPARFEGALDGTLARARALVLRMAALVGFAADRSCAAPAIASGGVARAILVSLGARATPRAVEIIDRALVLSADHELNPSTFTVRVAASTGADLYACVGAGLSTLSGPRHGRSLDRVEALIAEAGRPERARGVIEARARRGDDVPGFGHPLYPAGDPRAPPLLAAAEALAPRRVAVRTALAFAEAMRAAGREPPSVDLGLVAVALALGLPPGSATGIFAVGRAAGWIAHALEQRAAGFVLRPRARYTGPTGR